MKKTSEYTIFGISKTAKAWAQATGVRQSTLKTRFSRSQEVPEKLEAAVIKDSSDSSKTGWNSNKMTQARRTAADSSQA